MTKEFKKQQCGKCKALGSGRPRSGRHTFELWIHQHYLRQQEGRRDSSENQIFTVKKR